MAFLKKFIAGKIDQFADRRTFAQKLADLLEEVEGGKPEKIERTLLFNRVIFEFHDQGKIFIKLCLDNEELFYLEKDVGRIEDIGSVTLDINAGMMQMFLT